MATRRLRGVESAGHATNRWGEPCARCVARIAPRTHRAALRLKSLDVIAADPDAVVQPVFPSLPKLDHLRRDEIATPARRHRNLLAIGEARAHRRQLVEQG